MSTTAKPLGTDYALGVVVNDNLDSSIMRLTPSESTGCQPGGHQGLFDFMATTGIHKFRLVPVPECGSHLEALKLEVEREERRLARFPLCEKCKQLSVDVRSGETLCAWCREEKAGDGA